jgi:hypothetical protein
LTPSIKDLNGYVSITTEMEITMTLTGKRALTGATLTVDGGANAQMPFAFKVLCRSPKEIAMSIRSSAAFALEFVAQATQ